MPNDSNIKETTDGDSPEVTDAFALPIEASLDLVAEPSVVERAQRGDAAAIDALTRSHVRMVERMLFRMLGARADLEDLVQNVFLEMCRVLPRFRNESSFTTFLGGITTIVARRAMRPTAFDRRRAVLADDILSESSDPERATVDRRRIDALHRALSAVPDHHRIAFTLWALEGLEPKVIADMTGATLSATRSRIFYAQKHLKESARTDAWLAEWLGGSDDESR